MQIPKARRWEHNEPESRRLDSDVQQEIDADRDTVRKIVADYQQDWRTQAELEDILRRFRNVSRPPFRIGLMLSTRKMRDDWNAQATRLTGLPQELDFYPPRFVEKIYDGRERSPDDEGGSGNDGDGISYDGQRITTGPPPKRADWIMRWRQQFNPDGLGTAEEIKAQPNFQKEVMRYQVMFGGAQTNEVAARANTLTKYFKATELKKMYDDIDWSKVGGNYFAVITLHGRNDLKILAPASASHAEAVAAFRAERKKSETNAAKYARSKARQEGLSTNDTLLRVEEAIKRVRKAFETPIGLFTVEIDPPN